MKSEGLTRVSLAELERLLRVVYRDALTFPVTRANLIASAFGHVEEHLGLLIGLERTAAQRVLIAVIAERKCLAKPQLVPAPE